MHDCKQAFYRGDYLHVVQTAEKYLRVHPGDAAVRIMLARAELVQGDFAKAVQDLRKVLASDPHNIDALYYMSLTAKELSHREYQRLFALDPNSDRVHQLLGEAALAAENHAEAEAEFQNALKANPKSVDAATELAELKRSQSKFDEALSYYKQAEKAGPLTYEVAYGIGACYTYKQDYAHAIEWLHKAVSLSPDAPAARFGLGNALFQSGQVEGSIPELKASLRLEPNMKQAYFLLGRAYSKLGRQQEAQAAFKRLDELNRLEVPTQDKTTMPPKPEAETH
ncbi:MAG TPA: tetratricopeptide repeat protein [Terriglobales bacterium]|nr:tetratricopeptide repeat protein [Terriglobales bacterium]